MSSITARAILPTHQQRRSELLALIEQLGLAVGTRLHNYRFTPSFVILNALNGWGQFRRDPDRRAPLVEFERFCCEIACDCPPAFSLADRIERALRAREYACASTHFQAVMIRGPGDIRLKFLPPELVLSVNSVLTK